MRIYTRLNYITIFILPALAIGIGDEFWIEIAWLGFAIGITGASL
jgi:hypothetical protein